MAAPERSVTPSRQGAMGSRQVPIMRRDCSKVTTWSCCETSAKAGAVRSWTGMGSRLLFQMNWGG